jgi:hypothetical protein
VYEKRPSQDKAFLPQNQKLAFHPMGAVRESKRILLLQSSRGLLGRAMLPRNETGVNDRSHNPASSH